MADERKKRRSRADARSPGSPSDTETTPAGAPLLGRRIGTPGAVVTGLAAMLGAGVFVVWQPAAAAAGWWLFAALSIAAVVATLNAVTSARLASAHPYAGGAYLYGRTLLGPDWGFTAGWLFLAGKTASAGAMALVVGSYVWPEGARATAVAVVVLATALNLRGIRMTAATSLVAVSLTLVTLVTAVLVMAVRGPLPVQMLPAADLVSDGAGGPAGILPAAGLLFFAFAGYARMATLSEEVKDPARTLSRAIPAALGIVLVVYAAVGAAVLMSIGPDAVASSSTPVAAALTGSWAEPVVRIGAAVAAAGALLGVLAGLSRTALAMARDAELPGMLSTLSPRTGGPAVAELAIGAIVALAVVTLDPTSLIGFSSCAVLIYYAIAQLAALRLPGTDAGSRATVRHARVVPYAGLAGCVLLAIALPWASVTATAAFIAVSLIVRAIARS